MDVTYTARDPARVALFRDRKRDHEVAIGADAGATLAVSQTGVLRIPAFPDELRDVVPQANGELGERSQRYFGREYMEDRRRRELFVRTDAIYRFVASVAAKVGHATTQYWSGDASGHAMLTMMMTNLANSAVAGAAGVPRETADEHRRALEEALKKTDSRARAAARSDPLENPALRNEWERQIRLFERGGGGGARRGAVAAAAATGPPALPPAGNVPPSSSSAAASAAAAPAPPPPDVDPARAAFLRARPVLEPQTGLATAATPRAAAAAEMAGEKAAATPSGEIVYGVEDKYVMLLRLLLRGGVTETELKVWRMLYRVDDSDPASAVIASPEARAKYLRDLRTVEQMLTAGEGGVEWASAPQHTGFIFFTERFRAGLAAAMADVHGLCAQAWALELDLMTHTRVCDAFARLVAYHISGASAAVASRFGGTAVTLGERARTHIHLTGLFRRLERGPDGFLGFRDQINTTDDAVRRATYASRVHHLNTTGRYYTDAHEA